jgi:aminoglycoside 3-N-acetyltransferase I
MRVEHKRLTRGDRELARRLVSTMAEASGGKAFTQSEEQLDRMLRQSDLWALAACLDDYPIGGILACTLRVSGATSSDIFIYDIAVREGYRRQGVGRRLVQDLQRRAGALGARALFVVADAMDAQTVAFCRALGAVPSAATIFTLASEIGV